MKSILRLVISYLMIFCTPFLSALLTLGPYAWASHQQDYMIGIMVHAEINLAIIAVQIVGILLYFHEYEKNQMNMLGAQITFILSLLLILWGTFVTIITLGFYGELIDWSRMTGVRELMVWDHLEYGSWASKGTLWIISGFLLAITSNRTMESKKTL